ncbi:hypothetical protein P691DRAFT_760523 [Macrolepiota fuliginosa MF-IS2]|uniref:Uncharacterized protein n=1 Tax=Macrolepiota fuliginosa MF-IS2 TaxID=1400762 RepID=A0A9P6C3Q5_9AGAR|nr:hypothetical protein P691DRAFT_760523 [Macrolepiota fuliginosa MF-IS2]
MEVHIHTADTLDGQAWVVDGDLYFLPNCNRRIISIPSSGEDVVFMPCVSCADDFQEPCWWSQEMEWMGFVPWQQVPYSGIWFESLANIPNQVFRLPSGDYQMHGALFSQWLTVDRFLWEVVEVLRKKNALVYKGPFSPFQWEYHKGHAMLAMAMDHIRSGRDWFAMWIGLLYWMTRKTLEGTEFVEGLCPPAWFKHLVMEWKDNQCVLDTIRTAALLQRWWKINRVGIWLLHPHEAPEQPMAQWFIEQGVPVWYQWGNREAVGASHRLDFGLISPSVEQLQGVTTWICPAPSPSFILPSAENHNNNNYSLDFRPMSPPQYTTPSSPQALFK